MVAVRLTRSNKKTGNQEKVMARVAIVTGGTRWIGEAISIALKDM